MDDKVKSKKSPSMISDIKSSNSAGKGVCSDSQKVLKWSLIVGVPVALLIIVIIVVASLFANSN